MTNKTIKYNPTAKETDENTEDHTKMQVFEGIDGLKKIYKQTIKDKKPIFALTAVIPDVDTELVDRSEEHTSELQSH